MSKHNFNFDDLSFSGIVNIINNDEYVAKDFIKEAYDLMQEQNDKINKLEKELSSEKSHLRSLENSIFHVFKSVSWKPPKSLIFKKDGKDIILNISDDLKITIETNVL